jgi:hypothetical protein
MLKKLPNLILAGLLGVALLASMIACGPSYGHYDRSGYYGGNNSARQAYESGYRRGFDHGYSDRRNGYNYDFDHDSSYQRGISRDRYINERYRDGYERGYRDGYQNRRY